MTTDPAWENRDPYYWSHESNAQFGMGYDPPGQFNQLKLASFWRRLGAGLIDWGLLFSVPASHVHFLLGLAIAIFNSGYLAAMTTQSLGKLVFGIHMVHIRSLPEGRYIAYVPIPIAILRVFIHHLDALPCLLGFLGPLIAPNRSTIADFCCRTFQVVDPRMPTPNRSTLGTLCYQR